MEGKKKKKIKHSIEGLHRARLIVKNRMTEIRERAALLDRPSPSIVGGIILSSLSLEENQRHDQ